MANKRNENFYVPQELVEDILLRLPVKVLSRCKCVSKNWCCLIESKKFVRQHFESNQERLLFRLLKNQDQVLNVPAKDVHAFMDHHRVVKLMKDGYKYVFYVDEMFSEYEEPFHLKILDEAWDVFGPLNGVFCVVTRFPRGPMALVNPALRQFKPLPLLQCNFHPWGYQFDKLGMGSDPLTGEFKLVLIRYLCDLTVVEEGHPWVVYVCTSDSDSWRVLEDLGSIDLSRRAQESLCNTYLNGSYYWLLENLLCYDTTGVAIRAFDMASEKFQEIKVTGDFAQYGSGFLTLSRDSLALLMYDSTATCIDIWLMVTEGCWIKSSRVGPLVDISRPLCLFKNSILFETMTAFLAQCDVSTQESRTFSAKRIDHLSFSHWVYVYKESLVSIKGNAGKCEIWDPSSD